MENFSVQNSSLPDVLTITLGDRTYTAQCIIADGESVNVEEVVRRATRFSINSDEDEEGWFIDHQEEINQQIPMESRGKVIFLFLDDSGETFISWLGDGRWGKYRFWDDSDPRISRCRPVQRIV